SSQQCRLWTTRPDRVVVEEVHCGIWGHRARCEVAQERTVNIVDLQEDGRRELGDYDRLIYRGRTWRFEEIYQGSLPIAVAPPERDVQFGDRVGVVLPSSPEFHIAFPAIWRIGAVLVPIHYTHPVPEIANILRLTQCKVVITRAELAPRLAAELA